MGLKWATEAGDAEIWIVQIVVGCVPDGWTNHSDEKNKENQIK